MSEATINRFYRLANKHDFYLEKQYLLGKASGTVWFVYKGRFYKENHQKSPFIIVPYKGRQKFRL